jgi:PIN domain nuclease of toxin-antitoxin system
MISDRNSLTRDVCAYLENPENLKYLSIVSLQELITAFRTKKLLSKLWRTETEMISFVLNDPSVEIDNTDVSVIRTLAALQINEKQEHKDPFDHIIVAQAISHKMTLVSSDTKFPFYRKQGLRLIENK